MPMNSQKAQIHITTDCSRAIDSIREAAFHAFRLYVANTPKKDPRIKDGEHAFLCLLYADRADIADVIRGRPCDPYMDNANLPAFWRAVKLLW